MNELEKILETEFCPEFIELMKKAMIASFYKYGLLRLNYPENVDAIKSLKMRLDKYEDKGNKEFLVDIANFAMIEFMCPKNPKAHYAATDSNQSPGLAGLSVGEMKTFQELEGD